MNRFWPAFEAFRLDSRHPVRGFLLSQAVALAAALGALAAHLALGPVALGSVYLLCALGLLAAAVVGGAPAGLSATLLLAAGGLAADTAAGLDASERTLRLGLFVLLGLAVTWGRTRWAPPAGAARRAAPAASPPAPAIDDARRNIELRQLTQVWSLNSMGEMASILAHELNQPLSAVANYLRAARALVAKLELDDDDLLDAVSRAGDQAVRAGEIIRTMRDLAARGGTAQQPESLSTIVKEIDFIVGLLVRDAGARVIYDLDPGVDTVLADRIQIQQLMVNLVRNALDAVTKFPTRDIRISTRPTEDGKYVTTVEDSGPGIDPRVIGRIFQPLSSTKPDGMGLGLSICSAIVENHGGRIWVEPSPLGGAAFRFVLSRTGATGDDVGRTDRIRRR